MFRTTVFQNSVLRCLSRRCALLVLLCTAALGQTVAVGGRITDQQRRPLPNARVVITAGRKQMHFKSDANGRFGPVRLAPGQYVLTTTHECAKKDTKLADVKASAPMDLTIRLTTRPGKCRTR